MTYAIWAMAVLFGYAILAPREVARMRRAAHMVLDHDHLTILPGLEWPAGPPARTIVLDESPVTSEPMAEENADTTQAEVMEPDDHTEIEREDEAATATLPIVVAHAQEEVFTVHILDERSAPPEAVIADSADAVAPDDTPFDPDADVRPVHAEAEMQEVAQSTNDIPEYVAPRRSMFAAISRLFARKPKSDALAMVVSPDNALAAPDMFAEPLEESIVAHDAAVAAHDEPHEEITSSVSVLQDAEAPTQETITMSAELHVGQTSPEMPGDAAAHIVAPEDTTPDTVMTSLNALGLTPEVQEQLREKKRLEEEAQQALIAEAEAAAQKAHDDALALEAEAERKKTELTQAAWAMRFCETEDYIPVEQRAKLIKMLRHHPQGHVYLEQAIDEDPEVADLAREQLQKTA